MKWPKVSIGSVADILPGFAFKSSELGDHGTAVLKIGNIIDDGTVDIQGVQRLPRQHQLERHSKFELRNRDVIIAMTGATAGKVGRIRANDSEVFLLNQRVAKFCPRSVHPDYLWYVVSSDAYRNLFYGLGGGAAQPNMSGPQIASVEMPQPPYDVQERIAIILSAYDDLIENNRRRITLLEEAARQLYKEWFVRFRFPGHEHIQIIDGVPEGWICKTIEAVCETIGGGTPSTKKPEYWDNGNILWFTPTDVTRNSCLALIASETKISETGLIHSSAKMIPAGSILMTSRASVGFFGINRLAASTNQGFINIVPHDSAFRMYILQNLMWRVEEIRSHAGGSTYKEISKGRFRALPILVPPTDLAREYEDQASLIHSQVEALHITNQQLAKARDLLLPKLMSGAIAV